MLVEAIRWLGEMCRLKRRWLVGRKAHCREGIASGGHRRAVTWPSKVEPGTVNRIYPSHLPKYISLMRVSDLSLKSLPSRLTYPYPTHHARFRLFLPLASDSLAHAHVRTNEKDEQRIPLRQRTSRSSIQAASTKTSIPTRYPHAQPKCRSFSSPSARVPTVHPQNNIRRARRQLFTITPLSASFRPDVYYRCRPDITAMAWGKQHQPVW